MPADTNQHGDIFGGWLLGQMDIGNCFARSHWRLALSD
jgi:acyl-CoA hydrolase